MGPQKQMPLYLSTNVKELRGACVKKTEPSFLMRQSLLIVIPTLIHGYAPQAALAQNTSKYAPSVRSQQSADFQANTSKIDTPQPASPGTPAPALNVIAPTARPPLPPPPETPQAGQTIVMQQGTPPSLPQAWRVKAMQLFKSNNSLDKSAVFALHLQSSYSPAFEAIVRSLKNSGLKLEALSLSSGHILVSWQIEDAPIERAIIALRQAAPDSDSSASSGTDVRVYCDSRNQTLTLAQLKGILSQLDKSNDGNQNKTGAESL